ncbi:DUF4012 domain-containing protein [Bifidobacterium miconisargentati]|uniref:DUF4012 domain-containing protein n=1 Tax=Bifidobacterium miconisargentati TaxID=2834437 RepID=UPI001F1EE851|nr:DUF4012 domain-containing protein [Bifidobacterium miconisargentati]
MRSSSGRHGRRASSFRADDSQMDGLSGTSGVDSDDDVAGDTAGNAAADGVGNDYDYAASADATDYAGQDVTGGTSGRDHQDSSDTPTSHRATHRDTHRHSHRVHRSIRAAARSKDDLKLNTPQHVGGRKGRSLLAIAPGWLRAVVVVLVTMFAAATCVTALYAASVARMVTNAQRVLSSAESLANTALGCGSDESLSEVAQDLVKSTNDLNKELNGPQWDLIRDHTRFGNDITAAREMLASVDTLVNGPFTDLLGLAQKLQGFSMKNGTVDVSALMDMPEIVSDTHKDLKAQIAKLDSIPTPSIAKMAAMLSTEKTALQTVDSMLSEYDDLINLLPQLLGEDGERTYLVLVQNPAELRSSGGMIGTIAAVTANKGKVTIGDFSSTSGWDIPEQPLDDKVLEERAAFGDTFDEYPATTAINPEFQRVAQYNKYLWLNQKHNKDKNVAGVIGLDPVFLESLLDATGQVKLSDGKVLDGDTTVPFLLHDLYLEHPKFEEQNKYVSEAAQEIMTHVLGNINGSSVSGLLKAVRQTSAGGHLKLWMANELEQTALISTGLIDDKAGGELSTDESVPQAGIYLSELQQGKQDWYLRTTTTVTKTCGEVSATDTAGVTGSLDGRIVSAAAGTQLGLIPADQTGTEYTVTFTMKNTMTKAEAKTLPEFITGGTETEVPGGLLYRIVLTAPYGGEINVVQADTVKWGANTATMYDRQYVTFDQQWIEPGEERTIAFTVRVKNTATQPLDVVTTPVVNADGIETGSNGKVIDECPAELSPGAVAPGTGSDIAANDQANSSQPTNGSQSTVGGTGKDLSSGLSTLDKIKGQLSCPVDIKSLAGTV